MREKKAILLQEVVPLSSLRDDPDWVKDIGGEEKIEDIHNPSTFLTFYHGNIPTSTEMFILGEAGEVELPPDKVEELEKVSDILVGVVSEGQFYGDVVTGFRDFSGRMYIFPDVGLRAASVKEYTKIADGLKDLTSLSMARGKDIAKKKFLVELEESLFQKLSAAVSQQGISRNLLINLLVQYFLENPEKITSEILRMQT